MEKTVVSWPYGYRVPTSGSRLDPTKQYQPPTYYCGLLSPLTCHGTAQRKAPRRPLSRRRGPLFRGSDLGCDYTPLLCHITLSRWQGWYHGSYCSCLVLPLFLTPSELILGALIRPHVLLSSETRFLGFHIAFTIWCARQNNMRLQSLLTYYGVAVVVMWLPGTWSAPLNKTQHEPGFSKFEKPPRSSLTKRAFQVNNCAGVDLTSITSAQAEAQAIVSISLI